MDDIHHKKTCEPSLDEAAITEVRVSQARLGTSTIMADTSEERADSSFCSVGRDSVVESGSDLFPIRSTREGARILSL